MLTWEQIDPYHQRAAVIGGWLVKAYESVFERITEDHPVSEGYNWRVTMAFVPDEGHKWRSATVIGL